MVNGTTVRLRKKEEKRHSVVYASEKWSGVYIPKELLGGEQPEEVWLVIYKDQPQAAKPVEKGEGI